MTSALVMTLSVLTTITNVALIFSPVPDLYRVHRQRDTGEMVVLPLVSMWINNHFWYVAVVAIANLDPRVVSNCFASFTSSAGRSMAMDRTTTSRLSPSPSSESS